jgi:hypothetical protein
MSRQVQTPPSKCRADGSLTDGPVTSSLISPMRCSMKRSPSAKANSVPCGGTSVRTRRRRGRTPRRRSRRDHAGDIARSRGQRRPRGAAVASRQMSDDASRSMQNPTSIVGKDDKREQDSARECGHREEINSDGRLQMVREEGAPTLRAWFLPRRHQPRNRSLRDLEPQLQQFSMDPRCAPEGVREGHLPNQSSDIRSDLGTTTARSRPAGPIPRKAAMIPRDNRGGADDHQGRFPLLCFVNIPIVVRLSSPTTTSRAD